MKVLIIDAFFFHKGGVQSVFFNSADLLTSNGHEVCFFSLKWNSNYQYKYDYLFPLSKETRKGVFASVKNAIHYFYNREAADRLDKLLEIEKPDIAHIHLIWGQISPSIFSVLRKYSIPIIHTVHDYRLVCPAYCFRNGSGVICEKCAGRHFYKCFTNKCSKGKYTESFLMSLEMYFRNRYFNPVKNIDGIIYVSDFARDIHQKYMPELQDVHSATFCNSVNQIDNLPARDKDNKYFLYFGRLSSEKGLLTLLKTFKLLPNYILKVVGDGPCVKELTAYKQFDAIDNVEFLGYKSGQELADIVAKAYFTIVPSEWYENNPMSIIESYARGVPVIGAEIGGIPEIVIDYQTGFKFQAANVESLKEVIMHAFNMSIEDYSEMTRNVLAFAEKNFSARVYLRELLEFYNQILELKYK